MCLWIVENYIFQECNEIFKRAGLFETVVGVAEFQIRTGYRVCWRCREMLPLSDKRITEILTGQLYRIWSHSFAEI